MKPQPAKPCPICVGGLIRPGKKTCGDQHCVRALISQTERERFAAMTKEQRRQWMGHVGQIGRTGESNNRVKGWASMTPEQRAEWKAGMMARVGKISHAEFCERNRIASAHRRVVKPPRQCEWCGRTWEAPRHLASTTWARRRFCSKLCQVRHMTAVREAQRQQADVARAWEPAAMGAEVVG